MLVLGLFLISTALSTLACNSGEVYMKITKKSGGSWASEEFVDIYDGSTKLYTTPTHANNELRIVEQCLTATANNQYTIKLRDTYGDSWTTGSYAMVEGPYGNVVFKNFLVEKSLEAYPLSLYMPIMKTDFWKMSSGSVSSDWTQYSFNDASWSQVTLGSVTAQPTGTQYFRKQFVGLIGMAAYEVSFNYRYGIIAYINGAEIYRDNMPDGTPSGSTAATGSYSSTEFHSIIRPGNEVANAQSVLAVEIHFMNTGLQNNVEFDAYLNTLARSVSEETDSCFIYPYNTTLTTTGGTNVNYIMDWSKTTGFYTSNYPSYVTYALDGPTPFVNGFRVWPYTAATTTPTGFNLQGANSASASSWANVITASGVTYTSSVYSSVFTFFFGSLYSHYRLQINTAPSTTSYFYEAQPLICSLNTPSSIEFEQQSYSAYARYESILVKPKLEEVTGCTINPTPAEGLTFNTATCSLSGIAATAGTTTYTVTATLSGQQYTGSFSLQITSCAGTVLTANRVYSTNAVNEAFTIRDSANNVVVQVNTNSGQINNSEVNHIVCLTSTANYELIVSSTSSYWQPSSFLYLNAMFDGLDDYETILRAKFDNNLGLPSSYDFNVNYAIKPYETWSYKMNDPSGTWYNSETSGWSNGSAGGNPGYGSSTNQIQLYKKQFTVTSVENVAGLVVSLKYRYGVIIYLNSHEVFRKGFTGDLTTSTISSTSLNDVNYREISLPIKSMGDGTATSVDYVTTGQNTIAIGLIGATQAGSESTFDCAVRLMGDDSVSRVWKTTNTYSGISGYPSVIMNFYYGYTMYYSTCSTNYYQITFDDDRHEWISSVVFKLYYTQTTQQPRNVVIKAKNAEDSEWTTLKTVTGMNWSLAGQSNRIWITNSKSYNMYRFENFATGDETECYWKLSQIDLRSDATNVNVPALSYDSSIEIFKDIEMGEVYANSDYYTDFTINPPLPTGVNLDPYTGTISGTATAATTAQTYIVSAKKFNTGETVTAQFSFTVSICTGGRSLITAVARVDSWPSETSYKLYQGKGTTGTLVSEGGFTIATNLNYVDSCLNDGLYTFDFRDSLGDGWFTPSGYYLTVDVGEMKFEMGQVLASSATTVFSSYLPFQVDYDDWKVYKSADDVASSWNTINFDDSTWTVTKAAQIGTSEAVTVYLRRDITLDDASNYQVLNVRVKYAGGVVCYFNGRTVARFNLEEGFDSTTESIEVHDSTVFSKFHIVLTTVGSVTGKNVIAFEIHRPYGQSSAEPVVFDATGVFGVNDCSLGVDSIINVSGSTGTTIGDLENFFDLTPVTYGYQPNAVGTYLQWTVENLEGSKFNSFALETQTAVTGWGFSLYGRGEEVLEPTPQSEEYTNMFSDINLQTVIRGRSAWSVPVGIAGFRQFKHEVDSTASAVINISAYIFQYCKPSGTGFCEGVGDYPAVGEGEISPSSCEYGYRGYSYRKCENGQLTDVVNDKCVYKLPFRLTYGSGRFTVVMNTQVNIDAPRYVNIITKFYLAENTFLPDGLELDATTGAITGVATTESGLKTYTIYGENPSGVTYTTINLSVRKGECMAEGNFPKTQVGEIAVYECALAGSYVGTQKRACILGAKDGEWQKIQGTCMPIAMIVILVFIVIIVIIVVVFFFVRTSKKAKAVGGVKGKKSTKSVKKAVDKKAGNKPSTKSVKV